MIELLLYAVEGTRITRVRIADDGKSVKIYSIPEESNSPITEEYLNEHFPVVKAAELKLSDSFMQYKPSSRKEKRLKDSLTVGIKSGLKNFRRPAMDPTYNEFAEITYRAGQKPAVDHSSMWWNEEFSKFMPKKNSRMGTDREYDAFLGTLIKYLVEEKKYEVKQAWYEVCVQSKKLGHYCDSEDAKHDFEPTGSRQVGVWFDLANTCKILKNHKDSGFLLAGGYFSDDSDDCPLTYMGTVYDPYCKYNHSVGWLVLDE